MALEKKKTKRIKILYYFICFLIGGVCGFFSMVYLGTFGPMGKLHVLSRILIWSSVLLFENFAINMIIWLPFKKIIKFKSSLNHPSAFIGALAAIIVIGICVFDNLKNFTFLDDLLWASGIFGLFFSLFGLYNKKN